MFSPAIKRPSFTSRKEHSLHTTGLLRPDNDSPITPALENRRLVSDGSVPHRPATGTPAPWAPRLSVLARIPPTKKSFKGDDMDPIHPVFVGEFPQVVRDEQANISRKHVSGGLGVHGGMDEGTSLAWIISEHKLFIWSYLAHAASRSCVVLDLPSTAVEEGDAGQNSRLVNEWIFCVLDWDGTLRIVNKIGRLKYSAGILLCNRKTRGIVYWPDIYSAPGSSVSFVAESESTLLFGESKSTPNKQRQRPRLVGSAVGTTSFNSLIASAIDNTQKVCIAIACSSNGQIREFLCSSTGIESLNTFPDNLSVRSSGSDAGHVHENKWYPRSLIWHFFHHPLEEPRRSFLLLTDHEIQCFSVKLSSDYDVSKLWSHEIIGSDGDFGIQKGLAGQKRILPLDLQIDDHGRVITVLVATFCKDRATSSSYTEYSLLTMQYRSGLGISADPTVLACERVLEKKAPIQVVIPKGRVEDEDFLFSMRLKAGGKPSGSSMILSGDGTATVAHYWRNSTRLYQFDLPYDAGTVVDASVFPSDGEEGSWAVLTEKAGVWAIPEKAVLLGAVEPPERSLSRKGSSNEGSAQEGRRNFSFAGYVAPRRASSEAWDAGDRQRAAFTGIARRTAQDEESEALLNHLFHDFLTSGQVTGALEKLQNFGAFERDGETNVFARVSKSVVDTFAKHWTTTRGAEIVAMAIVSSQLLDKQQKHQKFLQFLALSRCHEELCSRQRHSLQIIMEHGEKLSSMIQLRELQNTVKQQGSTGVGSAYSSSENHLSGPLWDLIQLIGEKARQNTVLLMDRDNAEVFYSKVSELEELFNCLNRHLKHIVGTDLAFVAQLQRACEISNGCTNLLRAAMQFKNENHLWYPSPEGLTPWYCQTAVRNGLWSVTFFMINLLHEAGSFDRSAKLELHSHLEVLTELLLEAYSGAIAAKVDREEEHKSLLEEYWDRRERLFDSLFQQVKEFIPESHEGSNEGIEEQDESIFRKLSSNLLSLARRHEGYQTLWNLCGEFNDVELLRSLMHDSMGPKGGFSYFVFKQMYGNRQFSKLLRLGEEFPEELATFLKEHPDLLWLHELCLHQFSSASGTLHSVALSEGDDPASLSEGDEPISGIGGPESFYAKHEQTLADRRRLLNLSKIAAVAGRSDDCDVKLRRIEADLKLLKLQELILKLLPDSDKKPKIECRLLPPSDLIRLCLESQNRELSLCTFEVFAWTSSSFLRHNRSLLEECWRNAIGQDEWERIQQNCVSKGMGDDELVEVLKGTVLFMASSRCYGPGAETYEIVFEEVLPLRQEGSSEVGASSPSVEGILMQHRSFPDADRLMVTAIMLGSALEDGLGVGNEPRL